MCGVVRSVAGVALALWVAACTASQRGPERPITVADDVAWTKQIAAPELPNFYSLSPASQADARNQIVTARMYIADLEYHAYEGRLTREMQEEGLVATATGLGLTTAATLFTPAQTKTILSGLATAVTGLDKAYNEKELLGNAMQALQTQMRADRKAQAAVIYAKMYRDNGSTRTITPIADYTLPMALSDADAYYQAGTIASALIGLSKTVANADRNADQAKSESGPNPVAVSNAKEVSAPHGGLVTTPSPGVIRRSDASIEPGIVRVPRINDGIRIGTYEQTLQPLQIIDLQKYACVTPPDGKFTENLRNRILGRLEAIGAKDQAFTDRLTARDGVMIRIDRRKGNNAC